MKLKEYIVREIPNRCGVNPVFGLIAGKNFDAELNGEPLFAMENFDSMRERAMICMPYRPAKGCEEQYEHCLNVLEFVGLKHRAAKHDEGAERRMDELLIDGDYDPQEVAIMASDWWNG